MFQEKQLSNPSLIFQTHISSLRRIVHT